MRCLFPLLLAAVGCGDGAEPCEGMCDAAARVYGGCLTEWGTDWAAAGYADRADFLDACDTWAWEMRLLEDRAGSSGEVDAVCAEQEATLSGGGCDAFLDVDWNAPPREGA
jgi:hypothetical protein